MSFHVDVIPNRNSPPAILFRQAWREGKRIRRRTLANLSKLPPPIVDGIRAMLKGGVVFASLQQAVSIRRSLPHGHVAAVLGVCRQLGLERILHRKASRMRALALAAVVARVLEPGSKLATARQLSEETAASSLGAVLGLGDVSGNEMLDMLDWLGERQRWIEGSLANRHLRDDGTLILYDVSSSYLEGVCCPLAAFGYNRDGKRGKKQIVFGLLCSSEGCPVAVEVFAGNTADPATVGAQVRKIRGRFGISRVALVGDRGMLATTRIREDVAPAGLDWISALKTSDLRKLLRGPEAPLCPETLVADGVAEMFSPDDPGERLIVCLNPRLRAERARKREALLRATEKTLEGIAGAVRRRQAPLRGRERIAHQVGRMANRRRMEKHFDLEISDDDFRWSRDAAKIAREARLDGVHVVRTSLEATDLGAEQAVEAYKCLTRVERAFRSLKLSQLEVRPIYVDKAERVRAHVFLCMLAYYLEWNLRQHLAPMLFQDDNPAAARGQRNSPVEKAEVSESARWKAETKLTAEGGTVHSFTTLMNDLATLTLNDVSLPGAPEHSFPLFAVPTPCQQKAFELLEVDPTKFVASKLAG